MNKLIRVVTLYFVLVLMLGAIIAIALGAMWFLCVFLFEYLTTAEALAVFFLLGCGVLAAIMIAQDPSILED